MLTTRAWQATFVACAVSLLCLPGAGAATVAGLSTRARHAAASDIDSTSTSFGAFWQGFDFHWLRKVVGFETPHRLGTFASYIDDQALAGSAGARAHNASKPLKAAAACGVSGTYHTTLTPGVDGDYAHPGVMFTAVNDGSGVTQIHRGVAQVQFVDNSTGPSDSPSALSHVTTGFSATGLPSSQGAVAVLGGIEVDMKCVGSGCNSNGAWITDLNVTIGDCDADSSNTALDCLVHITLGRGWTPAHGGGKPYNDHMEFTFLVYYTVVAAAPGADFAAFQDQPRSMQSDIFAGIQTQAVTVPKAPLEGYTYVPAFTSFGFELLETKGHTNRGRYMEQLHFTVSPGTTPWAFSWQAAFLAPSITTYASDVRYTAAATVLAFGPKTSVGAQQTAAGSICENDKDGIITTFRCSSVGLPQDLSDTVDVMGKC